MLVEQMYIISLTVGSAYISTDMNLQKETQSFFDSSHFWVFYDMKIKLVIICQFFFFSKLT